MKSSIEKLFDLTGKVAIVTGGTMGIGKGIALRLAEAGASVALIDIVEQEEAAPVLREISALGRKAHYIRADLSDSKTLAPVVDNVVEAFGDLHILVNNAGIFSYCPVTEMTEELWDRTQAINLKAVAFLSQAAVNTMIAKKHGGKIINISSVDSIKPTGNLAHYDASKGGLSMLTRAFAKEVGQYGIHVNDIAPGGVTTPGVAKMAGDKLTAAQKEAMKTQMDQFIQRLPLQRMGDPEDIANAVLFLASDASNYMTGSTMVIDGGLLLM